MPLACLLAFPNRPLLARLGNYPPVFRRVQSESMKIAIYSRVSSRDKQDPENQLRQLRDFCAKQHWNIVRVYEDRATGKHADRDQFQQMFAAASRRQFDAVLFWALDRFSREGVFETLQHLQRLTSYGVGFRSFTEQYLDSCGMFRDAVIGILAAVAKQERIRLSERTIAGLELARAQGRVGGRPRIVCDKNRVLKMHAEGQSLSRIGRALGLSKTSVHRVLVGSR
jgi:DNA invertase Pin-like site-specific DNA recombinase